MEIIQTMWNAITTQNDTALTICFFLLSFVEASVSVLLFTTVFCRFKIDMSQQIEK